MKSLIFAAAAAAVTAAAPLEAVQPWSRPATAGSTAAGYVTLVNHGSTAQTLTGVASPLAESVEIHSSSMAGGVMSMKKEDRVPVPAGGKAVFGPGGYHLMLIGLTKTTKAGDQVPATLTFASGAKVKASFAVGMGAANPAPTHH